MSRDFPQVVLLASAQSDGDDGVWQFHLKLAHGESILSARDHEPGVSGERLELLAVVRGLEAIDRPSRVKVVTDSRYVKRMLQFGLDEWRENDWCWEHFGTLSQIKHCDLWKRVDQAFQIHQLETRRWRIDRAHNGPARSRSNRPLARRANDAQGESSLLRRARSWVADEAQRYRESAAGSSLARV